MSSLVFAQNSGLKVRSASFCLANLAIVISCEAVIVLAEPALWIIEELENGLLPDAE